MSLSGSCDFFPAISLQMRINDAENAEGSYPRVRHPPTPSATPI